MTNKTWTFELDDEGLLKFAQLMANPVWYANRYLKCLPLQSICRGDKP